MKHIKKLVSTIKRKVLRREDTPYNFYHYSKNKPKVFKKGDIWFDGEKLHRL